MAPSSLVALVAVAAQGFQPWRPALSAARRAVVVQGEALVECALVAGGASQVDGWMASWAEASSSTLSDPQFPVSVESGGSVVRLRYVAMPTNGVDVAFRPAGSDSPFGAVVVERVGPAAAAAVAPLVRGAEARVASSVRAALAEAALSAVATAASPEVLAAEEAARPRLDATLYQGSYGEAFESEVLDLFEDASATVEEDAEVDAKVQAMFAAGEALARAAAGEERGAGGLGLGDVEEDAGFDVEEAQFDVDLAGAGLKGGVDLFAAPAAVRGASAVRDAADTEEGVVGVDARARVEASAEVAARFAVLLREVVDAPDRGVADLVADAYRDVLLDEAFPTLARDALARAETNGGLPGVERTAAALDLLNAKVIDLVTALAEMAAHAEKQHLETIRLLCDGAKDGGDAGLRAAARKQRARLGDDFVAYLKHAVALESGNLRARGVANPANESSDWLAVLDKVRTAVYAELGRDVSADVDVIKNVLAIKDPATRRECLRLNVEAFAHMPDRVRAFRKTADNIFDNLLDPRAENKPDPALAAGLDQLRADLLEFLPPPAADQADQYLIDDAARAANAALGPAAPLDDDDVGGGAGP